MTVLKSINYNINMKKLLKNNNNKNAGDTWAMGVARRSPALMAPRWLMPDTATICQKKINESERIFY